MNVGQLREVLKAAAVHYQCDGRGEIGDALQALAANLLAGDKRKSVASLVTRIKNARKKPVPLQRTVRPSRARRRTDTENSSDE